MKAISTNQPWAALIVQGIKPVENRSWPTKYRGAAYVHAGSAYRALQDQEVEDAVLEAANHFPALADLLDSDRADLIGLNSHVHLKGLPGHKKTDPRPEPHPDAIFHFGAVIGQVDVIGCIEYRRSEKPEDFERQCRAMIGGDAFERLISAGADPGYWAQPGGHCFLLANPIRYPRPIACKGQLWFFELPAEVEAECRKQAGQAAEQSEAAQMGDK